MGMSFFIKKLCHTGTIPIKLMCHTVFRFMIQYKNDQKLNGKVQKYNINLY